MAVDQACVRFGEKVRELRKTAELSQEEFADRANLHRTYISGIERGERNISLTNLFKIARALGITTSQLLEGID